MIKRYKYKKARAIAFVVLRTTIIMLAVYLAVKIGIAFGDFLYNCDKVVIASVDVDNYRSALRKSLPIIDTIYNSGTSSNSLSGYMSGFFNDLFHFDLNSPITILNAESSIFHSYYSNDYQKLLAKENVSDYKKFNFSEIAKDDGNGGQYAEPVTSSIYIEENDEPKNNDGNAISYGNIAISNGTKYKINIEEIMKEPLKMNFTKKGPEILIYHTHTSEGYLRDLSNLNKEGVQTRTTDNRWNVVRVGEELAQILRKEYGVEVIHNAAVHDNPGTSGAYGRSLNTATNILKSYPSIKMVIDLHRDGLNKEHLRVVSDINGKKAAKIMFVVGTDSTGLSHPNWKENLKLAITLQEKLNRKYPGLTRPILISENRYNQHLSKGAMLVEVGGDGNLISECLESMKYLAEAIGEIVNNK
ncbi:stage II sporulation protein P [Acetivibrio clariflavus]|uniref:Stage II sporulation protein P n=1 Tax=Acetivibrio clariflavus (strain DSM 19732 / NBRC 101661 / EBR45) TaxID=720554 RepID=G8M319_ACECE|nr:stage II sporulation protein P [Acetivibrio clariflavus]AEV69328.1 stage II sporulation protein P [Acetivibrio clariflavus DSM 19732]